MQTKAEDIFKQVVETTGISLMPNITKVDATPLPWNPLTSLNKDTQWHKSQGIRNGTAMSVRNGSFKYRWGTSALVIEGGRHNMHSITATSTTLERSGYQEAYRS